MEITKELIQIFANWTKIKIRLHASETDENIYFGEKDIWWASLGQNIGSEENGKNKNFERPVLILKKFNATTFWSIAISSKLKIGNNYYPFQFNSEKFVLNLSQLRLLSTKRLLRFVGKIDETDFTKVREAIRNLLEIKTETPQSGASSELLSES